MFEMAEYKLCLSFFIFNYETLNLDNVYVNGDIIIKEQDKFCLCKSKVLEKMFTFWI